MYANSKTQTKSTFRLSSPAAVQKKDHGILHDFLRLLLPLIIGNILQQLYNTIDTVIVGRYASAEEFAAIGVASSVMNLLLFAIIGFCTGISVLFSQCYGAQDEEGFQEYHTYSLVIGGLLSIGLSILSTLALPTLLQFLNTPDEILAFTESYLHIVIAGLLISYLYNLYAALLRSIGRSDVSTLALFVSVILNTVLDLVFIGTFHMGIRGAAIATVISQGFSVLLALGYLLFLQSQVRLTFTRKAWSGQKIRKMLSIGGITCIHQVSLYIGKLLIQGSVNGMGTDLISAYTATNRIESFANSFGDSGYSVTSVLIAQSFGAGDKKRIQRTLRVSFQVLIVLGVVSSLVLFLWAPAFSSLVLGAASTSIPEATTYLRWIAIFYLFCFTGNSYAGYFDGLGRVKFSFVGALSHMTLRVILSYFWIPAYGLTGLAIATGIGWILVNVGWEIARRKVAAK